MRRLAPAVAAAAVVVALAAGCSSSDGAAPTTTTKATTTTTTKPEITDQEIIDNINEQARPVLEAAYDAETVECIIGVLEEGGTGKLTAEEAVPAYEDRCGVTSTEVTGVLTAAVLVDRGATEEAANCVKDEVASRTYEELSALDEAETNALYDACGIDVDTLSGSGSGSGG